MYRADTMQTLHDRLQGARRHGSRVPDRTVHSSRRWKETCGVGTSIDFAWIAEHSETNAK